MCDGTTIPSGARTHYLFLPKPATQARLASLSCTKIYPAGRTFAGLSEQRALPMTAYSARTVATTNVAATIISAALQTDMHAPISACSHIRMSVSECAATCLPACLPARLLTSWANSSRAILDKL